MRNFAVFAANAKPTLSRSDAIGKIVMDDIVVGCGIVETPEPQFHASDPANEHRVLVRVRAFSLNYRDKNRIFSMLVHGGQRGFYVVGSEFVAEVAEVGHGVTEFSAGDRVIGNNSYPSSGWDGVLPGVPTNHSSREFQIFHKAKLVKIPDCMPDPIAATFSIGAQTTYSMLRRLEIHEGANVLVTSGKSNTSLFAINALRNRKVNLWVTSTSRNFESELIKRGVNKLIVIPPDSGPFVESPDVAEILVHSGGIHFVIDPYFDLHLSRVLDLMAIGGKYITCGLYDQYLEMIGQRPKSTYRTGREMLMVMTKNLEILGNCIGTTADLLAAIGVFQEGNFEVIVDSVFSRSQVAEFLARTFISKDRFGKVVFQYD